MRVCIVCEGNVEGKKASKVREDKIIAAIRSVKKKLGIAKMNELYVCSECQDKHSSRRKEFEKLVLYATIFAGIILILLLGRMILLGSFDALAILFAFILGVFVLLLPLFKYVPAVEAGILSFPSKTAEVSQPEIKEEKPKRKPAGKRRSKRK